MLRRITVVILPFSIALAMIAATSHVAADLVTFQNGLNGYTGTQDTFLVGDGVRDATNWGARGDFYVGAAAPSEVDRALLRFDVSALAGQYTQINSITLRLTANLSASAGSNTVTLHQPLTLNGDWVEGSSNGVLEVGASSWAKKIQQASGGTDWVGGPGLGAAGYGPALASMSFTPTSTGAFDLTVSNPVVATELIADFLTGPNEGFLLRPSDESTASNKYIVFRSSENANSTSPQLIVDFTAAAIPEPPAWALVACILVLTAGAAGVAHHRSRRVPRDADSRWNRESLTLTKTL